MRHILTKALPCALILALGMGTEPAIAAGNKYKATQEITVDKVTGKLRKPNAQEVAELVASLTSLTGQPDAVRTTTELKNGGTKIALDGANAGIMLARPNPDGTFETRCVFTLAEATEFLGLVPDNSEQ